MVSGLADARPGGVVTANEANFSLPVGVAIQLHHGSLDAAALAPDALAQATPAIRRLAERIQVVHDLGMTAAVVREVQERLDVLALLGSPSIRTWRRAIRQARRSLPPLPKMRTVGHGGLPRIAARATRLLAAAGGRRSLNAAYDLDGCSLEGLRFAFAAHVTIDTKGGDPWSARLDHPPGACADEDFESRALSKLAVGDRALGEALLRSPTGTSIGSLPWRGEG